ncbi:hypothetical protein G9A89_020454 [Geosiphon pyriformis]|nr:hypothetical protein G9A89_020454 [Geosiphon pyriformis]
MVVITNTGTTQGAWSDQEISRLYELYDEFPHQWAELARRFDTRNPKQCRDKWMSHLRPNIKKQPFSLNEKRAIITMYHRYGPSWTLIASNLPGRSALMVKNFWYNMDERVRIRVKMSIARLV